MTKLSWFQFESWEFRFWRTCWSEAFKENCHSSIVEELNFFGTIIPCQDLCQRCMRQQASRLPGCQVVRLPGCQVRHKLFKSGSIWFLSYGFPAARYLGNIECHTSSHHEHDSWLRLDWRLCQTPFVESFEPRFCFHINSDDESVLKPDSKHK